MFPSLHPGDTVVAKRTSMEEVRRGDVVVVRDQGHYTVHRVVRKLRRGEDSAILTRGDISLFADTPVCKEHLIGKVVEIVRNGRHIGAHSPVRRATAAFLTMVAFAQTVVQSLVRPFDLRQSRAIGLDNGNI